MGEDEFYQCAKNNKILTKKVLRKVGAKFALSNPHISQMGVTAPKLNIFLFFFFLLSRGSRT